MGLKKNNTTIQGDDPNGIIGESEEGKSARVTGTESGGISSESESGSVGNEKESSGSGESSSSSSSKEEKEVTETEDERKLRIKRENDAAAKRAKRAAAKGEKGIVNAHIDAVPNTPSSKAKAKEKTPKASSVTADFLGKQIFGTHELMSLFVGEEVKISQADALMLGEAAFEVIKEYDLAWIGKFGKWGGLITAVAIVEVPVIMRLRKKASNGATMPMVQVIDNLAQPGGLAGVASGTPQ